MQTPLVHTNPEPARLSAHENLTLFLQNGGGFIAPSSLRMIIADLIDDPITPHKLIEHANERIRVDPFVPQARSADLRIPDSIAHLPSWLLRSAIRDLAERHSEDRCRHILDKLELCLAEQKARDATRSMRNYFGVAAAACLGIGSLEVARQSDRAQLPEDPPSRIAITLSSLPSYGNLILPKNPAQTKTLSYAFDRSSRAPLLEAIDIQPTADSSDVAPVYACLLENGETAHLESKDTIVLLHEPLAWHDGPLQVYDVESGELIYSAEVAALGYTHPECGDLCMSFYVPGTDSARPRTNMLDGRTFDKVKIVGPHGVITIEPDLKDFVLEDSL